MAFNNKLAKIYKLFVVGSDDYYIGSTFDTLESRIQKLYKAYDEYLNDDRKNNESFKLFQKHGDNVLIELIKEFKNIKTKEELKIKRDYYINNLNNNNKNYYKNYQHQYKQIKKEHLREYYQEYYKNNIDKIKARYQQRWKCEVCNIDLNKWSKARHERSVKHLNNLENKDVESKTERTHCEICNCSIVITYAAAHKRTARHMRLMQQLNNTDNNTEN